MTSCRRGVQADTAEQRIRRSAWSGRGCRGSLPEQPDDVQGEGGEQQRERGTGDCARQRDWDDWAQTDEQRDALHDTAGLASKALWQRRP